MIGKFDRTPYKNLVAEFLKPDSNVSILSPDKQSLQSWIGNRAGIPRPKRCYQHNATDTSVDYGASPYVFQTGDGISDNPVTIELEGDTCSIGEINPASSTQRNWQLDYNANSTGTVRFILWNGGTASGDSRFETTNTFTGFKHIVVTYDGTIGSIKIYIDGVDEAYTQTDSNGGYTYTANSIGYTLIQNRLSDTVFRGGKISRVRLFNSVLASPNNIRYDFSIPSVVFDKCDVSTGNVSFDSSGNNNHGTINGTLTNFYYEGSDVPYSWQNEVGFTISDGSTYYYDTGGVNLIPVGELIPRDESNPTKCCAYDSGGVQQELLTKGKIKQLAKIVDVPVGLFNGIDNYVKADDTFAGQNVTSSIICDFVFKKNPATDDVIGGVGGAGVSNNRRAYIRAVDQADGTFKIEYRRANSGAANVDTFSTRFDETQWHNIGFEIDSSTSCKLRVDGVTVETLTGITLVEVLGNNVYTSIYVGYNNVSTFLYGNIDINRATFTLDGVVNADWSFNEGKGLTVQDISGNGNHGTWQGTLGSQWGISNIAIDYLFQRDTYLYKAFDGVSSFNLASSYETPFSKEERIEVRIRWLSQSFAQPVINQEFNLGVSDASTNDLEISKSGVRFQGGVGTEDTITFGTPLNNDTWYTIVFTKPANSYQITVTVNSNNEGTTTLLDDTITHTRFGDEPVNPANGLIVDYIEFENVTDSILRRIDLNDFGYIENGVQLARSYKYPTSNYITYSWTRSVIRASNVETVIPVEYFKKIPSYQFNGHIPFKLNFNYYKSLPDGLSSAYSFGDTPSNKILKDTSKVNEEKKFCISDQDISANDLLTQYTNN